MTTNQPNHGVLYGIGVGPGNPEWMTLQAVRLLKSCHHIFSPQAKIKHESLALEIAKDHLHPEAKIHPLIFPMSSDKETLNNSWREAAQKVLAVLTTGQNACFITLGDPMLYSTFIYLQGTLRALNPTVSCISIPAIPSFIAAASITDTPLGDGKRPIVIIPATDELDTVEWALASGATCVIMKVGNRMQAIANTIKNQSSKYRAVLASRVGLLDQSIQTVEPKEQQTWDNSYLATLLVVPHNEEFLEKELKL